MNTKTLAIIKPDVIHRQHEIRARISNAGFQVVADRYLRLKPQQAAYFYREHEGRPFFDALVEFTCSGPCMPLALTIATRSNVAETFRELIGATDPSKAALGTIRRDFGKGMPNNAIHGSDGQYDAERELRFFFSEVDLW